MNEPRIHPVGGFDGRARIEGIDIAELDQYQKRGVPHDALTTLRHKAPVYWHDEVEGTGFWLITKHEDIIEVSKNPAVFSCREGGTNIEDYQDEDLAQIQMLMINMDPPEHAKYRRLISRGFTPKRIAAMEERIAWHVGEIMERVRTMGDIDFVREIAAELPLLVLTEILGVPVEDRDKVFDWSNRLIGFDDPEFQTSLEDGRMAAMEIWMYANELVEERRGTEGDDLVRVLMNAEVDGDRLDEMEFDAFFLLLSVAGNETTRNALSGGMLAMFEHPDQWQALCDDPSLVDSAVEEILRWVTPVMYFRRTALSDYELRGQQIKAGDKIVMSYQSANRDEEIFDNPFSFDIRRDPNHHLAFGVGEHFCIGNHLARLEIKVMLKALIEHMPGVQKAGEIRRLRSNFINGIKELPVTYPTW